MGEVYRARDPRLGREIAIKVLPADRIADEDRRRRFVQEARAAATLSHPHIVTIHEIESADDIDFIVMELVPGRSLDNLIPKTGMRLGEALRIAIAIADALTVAHAHGIVHRDLKPGNVMVTPDGVVKVLDFGLAKLTQAAENGGDTTTLASRTQLSHPGTVAGTPAYMSPEQASGGVVDTRSDIFSFGAILYEMLTGHRPFGGGSSVDADRGSPEGAAEGAQRSRAGSPERTGTDHPEMPAEGARPTISEHGRRQDRAPGSEGGVRLRGCHVSECRRPKAPIRAPLADCRCSGGADPSSRCSRHLVAPSAPRSPSTDCCAAHDGTTGRDRQLLARRDPDRLLLGR